MLIKLAFFILKRAMQKDPGYAWSWHCNIAMVAYDAATDVCDIGYSEALHRQANIRTRDFMKRAFGVDTSKETKQLIDSI